MAYGWALSFGAIAAEGVLKFLLNPKPDKIKNDITLVIKRNEKEDWAGSNAHPVTKVGHVHNLDGFLLFSACKAASASATSCQQKEGMIALIGQHNLA